MNKAQCKTQMNACLRKALNQYYASAEITQERRTEKLCISPRACSALQNGKSGFSAFSVLALFSLLPMPERIRLLAELCEILTSPEHRAA